MTKFLHSCNFRDIDGRKISISQYSGSVRSDASTTDCLPKIVNSLEAWGGGGGRMTLRIPGSLNGKTAYYIFILGKKKTTIKTPLGIYQEKQDPAKKLRGTIVPDKTANKIFTGCVN